MEGGIEQAPTVIAPKTHLVGHKQFVRHNPMTDRFEVRECVLGSIDRRARGCCLVWWGGAGCGSIDRAMVLCVGWGLRPRPPPTPPTYKHTHIQVKRFHHLEFYAGDATNAARRFGWGLGMAQVAKSDHSTGNHTYVLVYMVVYVVCCWVWVGARSVGTTG